MLPSFLLALREGLEIALIVGIVFGALHQFKRQDLFRSVRLGAASAILVSLVLGVLLNVIGASLEGESEAIFEGVMMWTAAGVLTWMILWMQTRASRIKQWITAKVSRATRAGKVSLFLVAFVIVMREGIELALFLTASVFASSVVQTLTGAAIGLALASLIGWGLFRATIQLNLKRFFQVTSILLVFFAAGLVAIPGQILKTLFGYNGNPSISEVISYLTYFAVLYFATRPRAVRVAAGDQAIN